VREAVGIINELDISGQTSDVQGDIYEYLLRQLATAGKNGQFRTLRHIIRMITELVDPDVNDTICDPARKTAGFLFMAYRYILRKYISSDIVLEDEEGNWHNFYGNGITEQKAWDKLHQDTFYAFDSDSTMVRIELMNIVLHGIRAHHIESTDMLSNRYSGEEELIAILANPPFKGSIDKNDINDRLTLGTTKTELLFVEKMYRLLEIGGK
jgi:type I restriction enzyme M protein